MDWKQQIGNTVLIRRNRLSSSCLIEVKVLTVSPQGRVKFKQANGVEYWEEPYDYVLVEVLKNPYEEFRNDMCKKLKLGE